MQSEDFKNKGKDFLQPKLEIVREKITPLKIWVKLIDLVFWLFYVFFTSSVNLTVAFHYRQKICHRNGVWRERKISRRSLL